MRKTLLLLLAFFCLTTYANMIEHTATFNFASPSSLTPSITPGSSSGSVIPLDNTTFTDGLIKVTFGRITPNNLPPQISTYVNPYSQVISYYLRINSGSVVTFSGNGVTIKKIQFYADGDMGTYSPLKLANTEQPGSVIQGSWNPKPDDDPVTDVSFSSNAKPSYISSVVVTYEEESIVLVPYQVSLKDGDESFQSMSLTFGSPMTAQSAANNIKLTGQYDANEETVNETLLVTGSGTTTIKLSLADGKKIDKDGSFEINIPAQSFRNSSGYENVYLHYEFTVREARDTFNPLSIDPDTTNTLTALTFPITLQFPDTEESSVGHVDSEKTFNLSRKGAGNSWTPLGELKVTMGSDGQVLVEKVTAKDSYTTLGDYKIEIPDGVVFNQFTLGHASSRHNAVLDLVYSVVDPLKEKKDSVVMLVLEVNSLLADYVGKLGYPINAGYLTAVKDLAVEDSDGEEELTTKINNLQGALNAFYNDTNIVLPEKGKWYTISSVNKEDKEIPLSFVDGGVTIGGTPAAFQIDSIAKNGTVVLRLKVGKDDGGNTIYNYLHVLVADDRYSDMTPKNVLSNRDHSLTKLKLGKMLLSASDGDPTPDQSIVAGLLTIKGPMGNLRANNEAVDSTFALVSHSQQGEIVTPETVLHFENVLTSAFKFAETDEPKDVVPTVTVKPIAVIVGESVLTSNSQVLTLKIQGKDNADDVAHVALKDLSGVKFTYKDGGDATSTANPILEKIANGSSDNLFKVHVNNLDDSTYTLVLPAGTFDFSENLKAVKDTVLTVNFTIDTPAPVDYSDYGALPETWGTIPSLIQGVAVKDSALLEVYYYVTAINVYPNNDGDYNVVELRERWTNTLIVKGQFESVDRDGQQMLKIVYNESLADKLPLKDGDYTLVIHKEAYGDKNFNDRQEEIRQHGTTSILKSACRVNKRVLYNNLTIAKPVEPTDPTGVISHIYLPDDKGVYFDMQGRRVSNPTKGIYILNGRKVVIK